MTVFDWKENEEQEIKKQEIPEMTQEEIEICDRKNKEQIRLLEEEWQRRRLEQQIKEQIKKESDNFILPEDKPKPTEKVNDYPIMNEPARTKRPQKKQLNKENIYIFAIVGIVAFLIGLIIGHFVM
jgi:hypothetical protein